MYGQWAAQSYPVRKTGQQESRALLPRILRPDIEGQQLPQRLQWACMIAHLRGKLLAKHPNEAIVETAGVGYDVTISVPTFSELPAAGGGGALHNHTHA